MRVGHAHRSTAHDDYATAIALAASQAVRGACGSSGPPVLIGRPVGAYSREHIGLAERDDGDDDGPSREWERVELPWFK
jgi:hypothetical protein